MAKQTGLGDNCYVGGYDLSGDVIELGGLSGGPEALECTAINKSAMERIGGVRTGEIEFTAWFNPSSNQEHAALKTMPSTDVHITYTRGTTLGNPAACMVSKEIDYKGERDDKGALTFEVDAQSNAFGYEWGRQLTAGLRTDTGATNGASVDMLTGSTTLGLQAYLQVTAFTGTDITIRIQESSDDAVGDAFANVTGGLFTTVTAAHTCERIATSAVQTVERYLRVITTGTFTSCTFNVVVVRNATAPAF